MLLKEISSHTSKMFNSVFEYSPTNYGMPIAGALFVSALFFFYIRRFDKPFVNKEKIAVERVEQINDVKTNSVKKKHEEICVGDWDSSKKKIWLVQRQVNETQYDLIWETVDKKTKQIARRPVIEDFKYLPTYKRTFPDETSECEFIQSCDRVLHEIHRIFAERPFRDSDEKFIESKLNLFSPLFKLSEGNPSLKLVYDNPFEELLEKNRHFFNQPTEFMQKTLSEYHFRRTYGTNPYDLETLVLVEKIQKKFLRTLPVKDRISYFMDHDITSVINDSPQSRLLQISKIKAKSHYDPKLAVDRDTWAITLIARSGTGYCGWAHALIAYEGIELGKKFIRYVHLKVGRDSPFGNAQHITDRFLSDKKLVAQSTTWQRDSSKVNQMLRYVNLLEKAKLEIPFACLGNATLFNLIKSIFKKTIEVRYNCLNWALETLKKADILLIERPSVVANIPRLQLPNLRDQRDPRTCIIC